jgi:hypothetical protein
VPIIRSQIERAAATLTEESLRSASRRIQTLLEDQRACAS